MLAGDAPLPPPLTGEQLTHQNVPLKNQFAPAVAGPGGSVFVFTRDGDNPVRWWLLPQDELRQPSVPLKHFKVPFGSRLGYSEKYPAKYASVGTAKGSWLIGPTVEFIRIDGSAASGKLKWPRNNVKAVGLPDDSVVVVGGYSWPEARDFSFTLKAERVWLDGRGQVQTEELPAVPVDIKATGVWESLWGFSLVHIGNGRVLLAGSEYRNLTLLLDPKTRSWQKLPGMKQPRTDPALVLLPDGRVWASGGKGWGKAETSSELWNPVTQAWTAGPDLPVAMVDHTAVLTANRDTALLAGGYFPTILGWKMGFGGVFIAAQHAQQRRNAGVVALPNQRLALLGGRYARQYGEGWGRSTPGVAVVSLDLAASGNRAAAWPTTRVGALLERQGQVLAVGGLMHHNHNGSDEDLGTRLVERVDSTSGRVTTLTPLPIMAGRTQAAWISDNEALIHAEASSSEAGSRQWLGLIDLHSGARRTLPLPENGTYFMSDGIHRRMRLVGAHGGRGWLVAEDAQTQRVGVNQPVFEAAPRLQRQRKDFVGRVLADGRVVIAGGEVESELVAARIAECAKCPVRYVGFGPQLPSRRHEVFDPVANEWVSSVPSRAAGGPATIFADGRVAKLGMFSEPSKKKADADAPAVRPQGLLEVSDVAGKSWRTLALPSGVVVPEGGNGVRLWAVQNEAESLQRALFFGIWIYDEGVTQWWWLDDVDSSSLSWRKLGVSMAPYAFPPGEQDSGLLTADGRKLFVVGGDSGVVAYGKK
ncbi:MAG: hypothetical protein A2045_11895 [Rhodocyclales bacterium GWA2_65_20]|nr:MAG: hypothetical protein A2045_11895 [Rhodocyclales bacterium GWA2_65_20]